MMRPRLRFPRPAATLAVAVLSIAGGAALGSPAVARAQVPSKFKNLKVLPKDISRDSLFAVMRGFTEGLGVRCDFCHVSEEGKPFSQWPFDSDKKSTKRKARFMLRMVEYLNGERLPGLPAAADAQRVSPPVTVTCHTCHHGVPVPRPLDEVLALTAQRAGADSATAEYGDLRKRYYGRGAYDFGEGSLIRAAGRLEAGKDADGARRLLELNLQQYPESIATYVSLARLHAATGDTAGAIDALEKAAALHPEEREAARIQAQIQKLKGGSR